MRTTVLFLALLAAAACGGAGDAAGPAGPVATTSVELRNTAFSPAAILVAPGATVTFTNDDGFAHNVTFADQSITSVGDFTTGARSSVMPSVPGTYSYRCTIHAGMRGTVKVQ